MEREKMIRKQVYLESSQDIKVKLASQGRGKTEAQIIREAIEQYLITEGNINEDPLTQLIGIVKTAGEEGSIRHDQALYAERDEMKE